LWGITGALIEEIDGGVRHLMVGGVAVILTEAGVLAVVLMSDVPEWGAKENLGILMR
jgi:hypothetical protein